MDVDFCTCTASYQCYQCSCTLVLAAVVLIVEWMLDLLPPPPDRGEDSDHEEQSV